MSEALLEKIEELRPWRYNHYGDKTNIIADNTATANVLDSYGRKLLESIVP